MARIVLVFVHVTRAIGIFAALAIEGAVPLQIRRFGVATAGGAGFRAALPCFGRRTSHGLTVSA